MAGESIIGLDIGSKFIKALQLTETKGVWTITEYGQVEINPRESLPNAVTDLFNSRKFKTKRVVSSVSGKFVIVRFIRMPLMKDEELKNTIKYELGKYIPFEVEDVFYDSQKLEELPPAVQGGQKEVHMLLVAAKKSFINEQHLPIIEGSKLHPTIIDVDALALGNAYFLSKLYKPDEARGECIGIIDIGASKTNVSIVGGSTCYFAREFYKGGDDISSAISRKLSIDDKEAEMLKRKPGDQLPKISDAVLPAIDDICHDIYISVDFFENREEKIVEAIYLTGGASLTPGLVSAIEETFDRKKQVLQWNPIENIPLDLPLESREQLLANFPQAIISLGLASRIIKE